VNPPSASWFMGRGIASAYEEGRGNASAEDIALRSWLARWSHHGRVHDVELVDGGLGNGVSLNELMDELEGRFREFGKLPGNKLDFD
jgi:hypothetical protein